MNPEWNTETKILYHLGTVLVVAVAVAVVLWLLPSDLAHALSKNHFLASALVFTLMFLGIALFHDRSFRNLLMAVPGGLLFSFMLNVLWPKWGTWRMVALSAATIAVGALVVWRRGANQRSAESSPRGSPSSSCSWSAHEVALNRHDAGALTVLGAAVCLMFGFFGFAVAVPWTTAVMPVSEAVQRCPGAIDPSWPAVFCNHSQPLEWKYGLIEDHPIRFALACLQMIVGWGAFFALAVRLKRYR